MGWSLVEEVGVDYARGGRHRSELQYPVFAARAEDGTTLVVDELAIRKSVPLRAEYRTLRFGADGKLLEAVGEGYGVPAGKNVALLRVTRWELVINSMTGQPVAAVDLSAISKHMPLVASRTPRDTFLVAFADELFATELAEVDEGGRLLWYLPRPLDRLGFPGSVQSLRNGNVLVADEFCHVVTELDRTGAVVWELGSWRDPGRRGGRFSSPRSAWETADGQRLVADTRNDRVVAVTGAGEVLAAPAGGLSSPTFADRLASGHMLVCDAGNGRVVEYDAQGEIAWACGDPPPRRLFSFPRAVEPMRGGCLLVADTGHDRVVVVGNGTCREWPLAGAAELFWPRCARVLRGGGLLVADGRNGRVLEVTRGGEVVRQLDTLQLEPPLRLSDPHDVGLLPGGHLLITDSPLRLVVEADWSGHVYRAIGGRDDPVVLDDPHSAQALQDGDVLICDSGHDRIIRVADNGCVVSELRAVRCGSSWLRLNRPRHAELSPTGALVVCDTGNNRVLAADESGELLWELSAAQGSPLEWFNQPRWAHLAATGELILCDHCHHRILRFRPA